MSSSKVSKGVVFTWGCDKDTGALGHKDKDKDGDCPLPMPVGLSNVIEVYAGMNLSGAITSNGELYTWGKGPALGHQLTENNKSIMKPTLVTMMKNKFVLKISFGSLHTLCLCRGDGELYSWGSNKKGQLGIGSTNTELHLEPCRINTNNLFKQKQKLNSSSSLTTTTDIKEEDDDVIDIQCCELYSALITKSGKLFTWGTSICLGHQSYSGGNKNTSIETCTEYFPRLVEFNTTPTEKGCSLQHTYVQLNN